MLFVSTEFAFFLAVVFCLYYLPVPRGGKAYQVTVLLLASALFYGWEDARLLLLLLLSCLGNTLCTLTILRRRATGKDIRRMVAAGVVLNVLLLALFKYAALLAGLLPFLPESWLELLRSIPLPVGISFYTFHGISLIVDAAKGEVQQADGTEIQGNSAVQTGRNTGFYLLFFPQLIAGPLVRARQFWPQIAAKRLADIRWGTALRFLILGYFFKMVCADNLAEYTPYLKETAYVAQMGTVQLLSLMLAYSFQIFADFGGYSFIAIGLGVLFGYRLPDNFNLPYISTSITEFWRRWNMTLSAWLRDYLYIPLGGNRCSAARTYLNLFLVMFIGGLWHGAEWKFALWGVAHGLFLAAERFLWGKRRAQHPLVRAAGWLYCFLTVSLLWMTFLMPDTATLGAFFRGLTITHVPPMMHIPFAALLYGAPVVLFHLLGWLREQHPQQHAQLCTPVREGAVYGIMLYLIINNAGPAEGFIYFQF